MQNQECGQTNGNLRISKDVIATIARYAVLEVEGVDSLAAFAENFSERIFRKQFTKPIVIDMGDDVAKIDVYINVKAGVRIPDVAEKVQNSVKEAVQNMTGIAVSRVNIIISNIVFDAAPVSER